MKKLVLNLLLLITLCSSTISQSLHNTTWYVHDSSDVLTYLFRFSSDSLFISADLINYYPLSAYSTAGQAINFIDAPLPGGCLQTDTGQYTFAIQNDTIVFTLVSDVCPIRMETLTTFHWVRAETQLHNTFWNVYNSSDVLTYKTYFGTDTNFISTNLSTYYPLSNFFENGNEFTIYDIEGAVMACPAADTGYYTFAIQNDTLLFTLVSDPCTGRTEVLTTYHWVRITTGFETQNTIPDILLFPNPSADGIFNLKISEVGYDRYSIHTLQGELILENIIFTGEYSVNLSSFPAGVYLLTIHGKQGNKVVKLVR